MKLAQLENGKKHLWKTERVIKNETNEKKSIIRINAAQENNK